MQRGIPALPKQGNLRSQLDPNPLPNQNVLSIVDPETFRRRAQTSRLGKEKDVRRSSQTHSAASGRQSARVVERAHAWSDCTRLCVFLGDAQYRAAAENEPGFHSITPLGCEEQNSLSPLARWGNAIMFNCSTTRHAYLLSGVLDLYERLEPKHLQFAIDLAESMNSPVLRSDRRRVLRERRGCEGSDHAHQRGLRWRGTFR